MTQNNNAAFLSKAESLFKMKDAVTNTVRDTEASIEAAIKNRTPAKRSLMTMLGLTVLTGVLLPTPVAPLFIVAKLAMLVGGMAIVAESQSNSAPFSVKFDSARQMEAMSIDFDNEKELAVLKARLPLQSAEVQEKFKAGFNAAAEKRAAVAATMQPESHIAKRLYATAII